MYKIQDDWLRTSVPQAKEKKKNKEEDCQQMLVLAQGECSSQKNKEMIQRIFLEIAQLRTISNTCVLHVLQA